MAKPADKNGERILWTNERSRTKPMVHKSRLLFVTTLVLLCLVGGSLFYVWSRIQAIRTGYALSDALKEEKALAEVNRKLRLEIAALKSYGRIEKIAVEELKMVKPSANQVIVIR